MLYAGMDTIKDGSTDWQRARQVARSPQYWGHNTWAEVGPTPSATGWASPFTTGPSSTG